MTRKLLFENVTCTRCGGTGHYSYCQMYGTVCFKCHGDGVTLTAKGRAAQNWFTTKRKIKAGDLKVGDRYFFEGIGSTVKVTVTGFAPNLNGGTTVEGVNDKGERYGMDATLEVRKVMMNEALRLLKLEALAFQATLTKAGTVRKRAAKMKEAANA